MKNNEEFRASVFEKAAAYKEKQRKKRSRRVRFVLVLTVCALIAVPLTLGTKKLMEKFGPSVE